MNITSDIAAGFKNSVKDITISITNIISLLKNICNRLFRGDK